MTGYVAGWADKDHGKVIDVNPDKFAYTTHDPIGVVGQIIPWNFPFLMSECTCGRLRVMPLLILRSLQCAGRYILPPCLAAVGLYSCLINLQLAPALAMGNTIVLKPSEFTTLTAIRVCSILKEAGLPDVSTRAAIPV